MEGVPFFFLQNTSSILASGHLRAGGGMHSPCTLSLDPPLVTNLFGDVLVKKSSFVWQRRTKILRTVLLSRIHISADSRLSLGAPDSDYIKANVFNAFLP